MRWLESGWIEADLYELADTLEWYERRRRIVRVAAVEDGPAVYEAMPLLASRHITRRRQNHRIPGDVPNFPSGFLVLRLHFLNPEDANDVAQPTQHPYLV